ncbi:hypothetical protein [Halomonas daqiaonensis]|uniref:hypothetical protein n=1 Tax=Halomonas daqiaonensis TaxID=650850 RepID=UPI000B7F254D
MMPKILIEFGIIGLAVLLIPLGVVLALAGFRRRQYQLLAVGIGCIILSSVLWWRTGHDELWVLDRCLDAGGRYDAQLQECKFG